MGEIKKDLIHLSQGEMYKAGMDDYIITEDHTVSDIVRACIKWTSKEEVIYLVENSE